MSDTQSAAPEVPYQQDAVAPPSERELSSASGGGGLLAMIERLATNPSLNLEVFDRLLKARHDEEDRAAKRAYLDAKAKAKGELPPILKTRLVDYAHKDGRGRTKYKYEDLFDITQVVDPILAKHGLSYSHRVTQNGAKITVTCIFSHADGYSEEFPQEGVEDTSGQKSANQAVTSTITFMQRATLKQALGLAAGRDDDGAGGTSVQIVSEQANELRQLFEQTGRSVDTMLKLIGVDEIDQMNVDQFMRVRAALNLAKAEQRRKPGNDNAPRN
jgi:ERF superfamily